MLTINSQQCVSTSNRRSLGMAASGNAAAAAAAAAPINDEDDGAENIDFTLVAGVYLVVELA